MESGDSPIGQGPQATAPPSRRLGLPSVRAPTIASSRPPVPPCNPTSQANPPGRSKQMGDPIDWNNENNRIICELLAEQVEKGNRPTTHLNSIGYTEVSARFFQLTGIEICKTQIKNKWDKLKTDLQAWQKLMLRQTGTGWDNAKGTIKMDNDWWKKARADIPGCGKFKRQGLQHEDLLLVIFRDITNDGRDHWSPMGSQNIEEPQGDVGNKEAGGSPIPVEDEFHDTIPEEDEVEEVSPSIVNGKRRQRVVQEKGKKLKSGTALAIQQAVNKISQSASTFVSRKEGEVTVTQVMEAVVACGAGFDTNEHYLATQLFVKKDQREMFMTIPTNELRLKWLQRKYNEKYGN